MHDRFMHDLRHALASLLKAPTFALLTLLTLTCGIGFAIYSWAIFLSFSQGEIPFPEAQRLVAVEATRHGERTQANSVHYLDYLAYADPRATPSLEGLQALNTGVVTLGDPQHQPEAFRAAHVPAAIWPWLGQRPEAGRLLEAADEQPGAAPVVVIGAEVWRRFLGADPQVIGRHIKVDGVDTTIVGVLPAALRFPITQQVWLPFRPPVGAVLSRGAAPSMGTAQHVLVLGRLKPGASRAQLQAELDVAAQQLASSFPKSNQHVGARALPYSAWGMPDADAIYIGLGVAAALLLALVCINSGNLLLARSNERRQEVAVRAAMGAPAGRLMQQMLAEAWLLCLGAAALGLFFSAWALAATQQAVQATADGRMPFWLQFQLQPGALAFGLALALGTTLLTGGLPAWRATRIDVAGVLRDGQRGGTGQSLGRAGARLGRALVMVQICLSSLLLLVSGAQTYAVQQRLTAGTGARMAGVLIAEINPSQQQYRGEAGRAARAQLWARLETALQQQARGLAGAEVALSSSLPGGGMRMDEQVLPEGMEVQQGRYPFAGTYAVNAGFFKTMDVKLLAGREFSSSDRADSLPVAVVNENFAAQHWPGQNALGKRFAIVPDRRQPGASAAPPAWITIVGISSHLMQGIAGDDARRAANIYLPISQNLPDALNVALVGSGAGEGDNAEARAVLARAVSQADAALALEHVASATERQRLAYGGTEVMAVLCLVLGLMSLLLAVSGIYGVTSRAVAQRTQEIGVRRAVGASDAAVLRMILSQGLWQLLLGLPLGLTLAWAAIAEMSGLDELGQALPLGTAAVALLIVAVLLFSSWLPARRAIALPPNRALQGE